MARGRTRRLLDHDSQRIRKLQMAPFVKGEPEGKVTQEVKNMRRARRFSKDMRLAKARRLTEHHKARRLDGHEIPASCGCTGIGYSAADAMLQGKPPEYGTYCAAWDDGVCFTPCCSSVNNAAGCSNDVSIS
jgi:hypothetical protein